MKYRNNILFTVCLITGLKAMAVPGTYYNTIDSNQTCNFLKTQLYRLISTNFTQIPYGSVDNYYDRTDLKPAETGGGFVIDDRYSSDIPNGTDSCNYRYPAGFCGGTSAAVQCVCYEKEHVFPSSWFGGTNMYPFYTDMHFIWPADAYTNFRKGNLPLGYVSSPSYTSNNGTKVGTSNTSLNYGYNSSLVFEPNDAFKGDFARAYLFFITRYEDSLPSLTGRSTSGNVLAGNKYPGYDPWILQLGVKWHKSDPPGAFEIKRNDSVYSLQANRNPYIDYPGWVEKVFGADGISSSCLPLAVRNNKSVEFEFFPNPANDQLTVNTGTLLAEDAFAEVIDILGQKLIAQKINSTLTTIDISKLVKGIYFINLNYKDVNTANTFIKK
jgi:endonuclease I